jgi:hypothetical protein
VLTNENKSRTAESAAAKQARASRDQKNGTVTVSLRVPRAMLKEVDKAVKDRPYKMPRHMWLLEAVHEKLIRSRETEGKAAIAKNAGE